MMKLMNKTEIKDIAQWNLLNDGTGAFLRVLENDIERLEQTIQHGRFDGPATEEDRIELQNEWAVYHEMEVQFDRMKKFFLYEGFQGSH
jgi:hypothetical protein